MQEELRVLQLVPKAMRRRLADLCEVTKHFLVGFEVYSTGAYFMPGTVNLIKSPWLWRPKALRNLILVLLTGQGVILPSNNLCLQSALVTESLCGSRQQTTKELTPAQRTEND